MRESEHTDCGCQEYNELSRRNFIIGSAGAALENVDDDVA